jgi:hypothetical protein
MRGAARSRCIGHEFALTVTACLPTPHKAYRGKARAAMYGDERRVMEWTMPLAARLRTCPAM